MIKYELGFGTIHNCFEIETSEEYDNLKNDKEIDRKGFRISSCLFFNEYYD